MAQPSFLSGGTTPRRSDTRWFRWTRILGQYQNQAGALAANNPSRTDPIWRIKQKILYALNGIASSSCVIPATPTNLQIFDGSPSADWAWDYGTNPAQDFLLKWGTVSGGPYNQQTTSAKTSRVHGTLAAPGAYFGVIIARNSTSCVSLPSSEVAFNIN